MTQQELLTYIQDALQRDDELKVEMNLQELEEWDSLAIVSLISLYDTYFGISVTGNVLRECQKVSDLIAIAENKLEQ